MPMQQPCMQAVPFGQPLCADRKDMFFFADFIFFFPDMPIVHLPCFMQDGSVQTPDFMHFAVAQVTVFDL